MAGGDRSLVPFAAIGIAALTYILPALHRHRAAVGNAWLLVLAAFGLFASVAVQEWMEHHLAWPEWLAPTRMVVEEGTAIVVLALFSVFLVNRTALSLTVSHLLPLGFAALLLQRLRRHSPAPDEACRSQVVGSTPSTGH